jgi:hypothetical protein
MTETSWGNLPEPTNYKALTASLSRANASLARLDSRKTPNNRERIFYANLVETFKLTFVIRELVKPAEDQRLLSSESVEALARLLYERSLLVRRLEKFKGEEPFLRFLKTSDDSMAAKWSDHEKRHGEIEAKQLPNYRNMADDVDPTGESANIYQQMSHLAHPRTSIPYNVTETTQCKLRKITAHQYFDLRCALMVPVVQTAVDQICSVADRELIRLLKQ